MQKIDIISLKVKYNKENKTFIVSGKLVKFDTSYELFNSETNQAVKFELSHSTGSEWDPKTIWVYKSTNGFILNVGNDEVTPKHAEHYLNHKLGYKEMNAVRNHWN